MSDLLQGKRDEYRRVSRGLDWRHLRKAGDAAAELYPRLLAVAVNFHARLDPRGVVERTGSDHTDAGQTFRLGQDRRAAIGAKAANVALAAVRFGRVGLRRALNGHGSLRDRHRYHEGRAGLLLAIFAMAHADKHRLGVRRVPYFASQAAAFYFG